MIQHGHSHGAQPCHGHGGRGGAHRVHPRHAQRMHGPIVPGTGMTRASFAKIVCPTAVATLSFEVLTIYTMIYGCGLQTVELPVDGLLFTVFAFMVYWSFLRGACSRADVVKKEWIDTERISLLEANKAEEAEANASSPKDAVIAIEKNDSVKDFEESKKKMPDHMVRPPRSHFCFEYDSNILRMDHYCVWYNNVIGLNNYKYFILSLVYLLIACLITLSLMFYRLIVKPTPNMEATLKHAGTLYLCIRGLMLIVAFLLPLAMTVFSVMHLRMHLWQIARGLTSIEAHKFMRLAQTGSHMNIHWPDTHEFDFGVWENCKRMLGKDWWFWWLPTQPQLYTDGYRYDKHPTNQELIETFTKTIMEKRKEMWKKSNFAGMKPKPRSQHQAGCPHASQNTTPHTAQSTNG